MGVWRSYSEVSGAVSCNPLRTQKETVVLEKLHRWDVFYLWHVMVRSNGASVPKERADVLGQQESDS